eukprot:tig00000022_g4807.t1
MASIFVLTSVRCVVTRLTGSSEAVLSDLDPAAFILPTIPAGQIPYAEPSAVQALNANGTGIYVDVKGLRITDDLADQGDNLKIFSVP